jgi:membrane protein implicated in regulation of membrane protease activity
MGDFIPAIGSWFWWIAAGVLFILELMLPGVFFLWLGIAAVLTGAADLMFALGWQAELLLFSGLSLVLVLAGWPLLARFRKPKSDAEHLNRRMDGYVGRVFVLEQALENGVGKLRIEDTLWTVEGPDLPAGTRVRVTAVSGMRLSVDAA